MERALIDALNILNTYEEKEIEDCLKELDSSKEVPLKEANIEKLTYEPKKDDTKLELKMMLSHLKYVYLEKGGNKPVNISSSLSSGRTEVDLSFK